MNLSSKVRSIKLICAYLGTSFFGWQETKQGPSVEGALREALEKVLRHPVILQAASRTDRGVHAEGQVVQFETTRLDLSLERLRYALQGLLAPHIAIRNVEEVEPSFHPTLSAKSKEYHYYLCLSRVQLPFFRETSWHIRETLNLDRMQQAMQLFIGQHDFRAFCNQRKTLRYTDYTRTLLRLSAKRLPHERLCIEIEGDRFLYKMARNLVGTLVQIGSGAFLLDELKTKWLSGDRKLIGMTAPAHGLFLKAVHYDKSEC